MNIVELLEEKAEFVKPTSNGQIWSTKTYAEAEALIAELGDRAKPWNFIPWQNHYPSNETPTILVKM